MKQIFYSALMAISLSSILFSTGCKKTSINGHVLTQSEAYNNGTTTVNSSISFTYDAQGRLTQQSPSVGTPTLYSYSSGSVTQSTGTSVVIYQLNSQGLVISDNQGNSYVYDNNGYNTNITNTAAGTSTVNSISNGDIANSSVTANGVTTQNGFTYLTNVDYRNYGQSFFGKNSVHLINTQTVSQPNTATYNFSYSFDSKGRVTSQTIISGNRSDVVTYTYQD